MKWLLYGIGGVVALVLLVALVGALLPREHVATSRITLRQPPDTVWKVVRDLGGITAWWPDLKQAERAPDQGGSWIYEIAPADGGSRVSVTERGWIANPIFRFMARVVFGYHGTLDSYLKALGRKFGEEVAPTHER